VLGQLEENVEDAVEVRVVDDVEPVVRLPGPVSRFFNVDVEVSTGSGRVAGCVGKVGFDSRTNGVDFVVWPGWADIGKRGSMKLLLSLMLLLLLLAVLLMVVAVLLTWLATYTHLRGAGVVCDAVHPFVVITSKRSFLSWFVGSGSTTLKRRYGLRDSSENAIELSSFPKT